MVEPYRPCRTTVLKIEGPALDSGQDLHELHLHLRELADRGEQAVVVHGADSELRRMHEALQVPYGEHGGLRLTSNDSMRISTMIICGLVNKRLVAHLVREGHRALGLSGIDLGILEATFLNRQALGRVGGPPRVRVRPLRQILAAGWTPVVASVCLGPDGLPIGGQADTVAHAIASELGATGLEFVNQAPHIGSDSQRAARLTGSRVQELIGTAQLEDGLGSILQAAVAALTAGVTSVRVGTLSNLREGTATEIAE